MSVCPNTRERKRILPQKKKGKDEGVCREGVFVEILGFIVQRRFCQAILLRSSMYFSFLLLLSLLLFYLFF